MTIREELERREEMYLSEYAMLSRDSKGRKKDEEECDLRPVFQRDRDRMTHTLEVAQNARTIAKALRLNEDLAEAIALGHDLGHTPFGHAGERALDELCENGFRHNEQSVRVVKYLEKNGEGLNLTYEVLDGILKHQTKSMPETLEGQIVRLSDKIAYVNHDIDDAIRAGVLKKEDVPKEFTDVLGTTIRSRLNTMVHDVISNSAGKPEISMSEEVQDVLTRLRCFMYEHVYRNPVAKAEEEKAVHLVGKLYDYYMKHPDKLPKLYHDMMEIGHSKEQVVCDYIAGMTDNYAVLMFEEFFIPQSWKN